MRKGGIDVQDGILRTIVKWIFFIWAGAFCALLYLALFLKGLHYLITKGHFFDGVGCLALWGGITYFVLPRVFKQFRSKGKETEEPSAPEIKIKANENTLTIGFLRLNNPFRGIFVLGTAGSGKSESIAVPALKSYLEQGYTGLVYDFKFPTLYYDVELFKKTQRHVYFDLSRPHGTIKINPIHPDYIKNSLYAREYANVLLSNLNKESIKKPDYWSRSATDLLTACILYLATYEKEKCDLPHLFALITSDTGKLLELLSQGAETAQLTIQLYNSHKDKAFAQVQGVFGTLQSAIAQINTPEICYCLKSNDIDLNLNNTNTVLTIGNNPILSTAYAPICALITSVTMKLCNTPHRDRSFYMLDEAPTLYIPSLMQTINTGRSNKMSVMYMCQDLTQITEQQGQEQTDLLFASLNNHIYGRVASSKTAKVLSEQFGEKDVVFTSASQNHKGDYSASETLQRRKLVEPSEIMQFGVGEFVGQLVESNHILFRDVFKKISRTYPSYLPEEKEDRNTIIDYYHSVRVDINEMLA